ncbi:hypothetical protein BGZ76_006880 [Entomortierella beljakovae]|nr:hypothetical protein BGZ76_006880 [Entomortierella beljakovae]
MSGNAPEGTGYVGTLTPDQTKSLKKLWVALDELIVKGTVTVVPEPVAAPEPEQPAAAAGWGGWFSAAPAAPVVEPPVTVTLSEHNLGSEELDSYIKSLSLGDNPDSLVLRFLRARKWHVGNGLLMMVKAIKWRKDEDVENVKLGEDALDVKYPKFKDQLHQGKFYIHGTDKKGQPVVYLNVHLHRAADQDAKTLERLTIYLMETGRLLLEPPVETVILVFDLTLFGLANMDYTMVQFLVTCFEAYYPESLGAIVIHNAPYVFWGAWTIIKAWLDPVVSSKIKFTYTNLELTELIAPEHLPDSFKDAGKDKYQYEYLPPVAGENDGMNDEATKATLQAESNALHAKFKANTKAWMQSQDDSNTNPLQVERDGIAKELRTYYFKSAPYFRAKSQFHRKDSNGVSVIQPDGSVKWTYNN